MEELILKQGRLKEEIVGAINNSELPMFIVKPILEEILTQVSMLENEQYQNALRNQENQKDVEQVEQK